MEERKGTGVFLGVVAVATLIVAIIGATFAYFSISAASNNDAVNLTAYEFNASLSVSQLYPTSAGSLVPLNPTATVTGATGTYTTNLLYAINTATNRCIDTQGFQVCAVYTVQFTNNGSQNLSFTGVLKTVANTASTSTGRTGAQPFQDLMYQALTGSENSLTTDGTAVAIDPDVDDTVNIGTLTVNAGQTVTKYIAIYLNENGDQSDQMGATFNGQLIYTSTNGTGSQLTGTFTLNGD